MPRLRPLAARRRRAALRAPGRADAPIPSGHVGLDAPARPARELRAQSAHDDSRARRAHRCSFVGGNRWTRPDGGKLGTKYAASLARSIRVVLEGEARRTAAGSLVVWDLVFLATDIYTWHRTDWPAWHTTEPLELCSRESPDW